MKVMERQNPHQEERYPTKASLTPVSLDLKKNIKKQHTWLTHIFPHLSVRWTHVPGFSAGLGHLHRPGIPLHGRST